MSLVIAPFDDTFQLDDINDMSVDVSDSAPIVKNTTTNSNDSENDGVPEVTTVTQPTANSVTTTDISKGRAYVCVAILLTINLLNYMDRYTIAGIFNVY